MNCIKCKNKAHTTIKVNIFNIKHVHACKKCELEIRRDFNLALVHDDSGDVLFIKNILNKYKL